MLKRLYSKYRNNTDVFNEYLFFVLSSIIFNGSKFLIEMIAAKKLGPDYYGIWAIFLLVVSYAWNLHLGVVTAFSREIPYNMGKGDFGVIEDIKQIGFKVILLTVVVFGVFISLYGWLFNRWMLPSSVFILIFFFLTYQLYQYIQYVLIAGLEYNRASFQRGITGILILAIAVPLLLKWRFNGLIIGHIIVFAIGILWAASRGNVLRISKLPIRKSLLFHLFKIGFPLMAIGFLYMIITGVDRWIVLTFLGTKDVGYYSFSCNMFSVGLLFITLFATQCYQRLSFVYGETGSVLEMTVLLRKQIRIALMLAILAGISILCILPIVIHLMPTYQPSLRVAQILVVGLPFLGVALIISGFFNVIGKQQRLLLPMVLAVATNLIVGVTLIKIGYSKEGVAIGTVISYVLYCFLLYRSSLDIIPLPP